MKAVRTTPEWNLIGEFGERKSERRKVREPKPCKTMEAHENVGSN